MKHSFLIYSTPLLLGFLTSFSAEAKIDVQFVPNRITQGQSVEMILSSDQPFSGVPNLDVLQKDFLIGGQQKRQSSQWINGKSTNSYQLIYTLFPNKSGTITVDGLSVGNEAIPASQLVVSSDPAFEQKGQIQLSFRCANTAVYPGQKLLCDVLLEDSVGLQDGQIFPPSTNLGTWEQILPPTPLTSPSGVQKYQSTFSFIPKQSGKLDMPPFTFQGQAYFDTQPRKKKYDSLLDIMILGFKGTATRPVAAQTTPVILEVKEKPAAYQGWWLPSTNVTLQESYQMPDTLAIGEPILRTLTLSAVDVLPSELPVPTIPGVEGMKVYINPEKRQETSLGAQLTLEVTFVPIEAGEITLPAINVPWFNTQTEAIESAFVPAQTIFVPGDGAEKLPPKQTSDISEHAVKASEEVVPSSIKTKKDVSIDKEEGQKEVPDSPFPWGIFILSLLGAFALGIGLSLVLLRHHVTAHSKQKKKKPLPDLYPF